LRTAELRSVDHPEIKNESGQKNPDGGRQESSSDTIRIANDLSAEEIADSAARNSPIPLRRAIQHLDRLLLSGTDASAVLGRTAGRNRGRRPN
jgi:hypothetical protein